MKTWTLFFLLTIVSNCHTHLFAQTNKPLTLDDCIELALKNNQQRAVSQSGEEIAKSRLGQARSAYWPQVTTQAFAARLDDEPIFVFPEETESYSIGGVLPQPIVTEVTIPEKTIKLLGQNLFKASANITLPLYPGGLRPGLMKQARAGVQVAHQNTRRTNQEIFYQVRHLYFGAVLAQKLTQIAEETLAQLTATLELTESLYKKGSGKVKKTDYLKSKVFVESVRGMQTRLQAQADHARTGLIFYLGLPWENDIALAETTIPIKHADVSLNQLVDGTLRFNPNWLTLQAGLDAYAGKIQEAKSGTRPRLALIGNLEYVNNNYDKGIVGPQNKRGWQIGLGLELPLFNGFRTHHKVKEMKAKLTQLEHQKILLHEGLATQIKVHHQKLLAIQQHLLSTQEALNAAEENHQLTNLGYQADLLEAQDLVEAQIIESIVQAQYHTLSFEHYKTYIQIEKLIGSEIGRVLNE